MDSNVGLAIQCGGILLITLLSLFIRSSIKSVSLKYWTASWASLSVALLSLFVGFHVEPTHNLFYSLYFFGEYVFGLLFIAGCQNQVSRTPLQKPRAYYLIPALVVALALPYASRDFNDLFMIHSVIVATLFMTAFITLHRGLKDHERSAGIRVMSAALLLLTAGFLHY